MNFGAFKRSKAFFKPNKRPLAQYTAVLRKNAL